MIILSDERYFYVIDMKHHDREPLRFEQKCVGLFLSDNNYMYTLTNK